MRRSGPGLGVPVFFAAVGVGPTAPGGRRRGGWWPRAACTALGLAALVAGFATGPVTRGVSG